MPKEWLQLPLTEKLVADNRTYTSSRTYDAGNRITNWNRPTATASAQTWNYDNAGNWNSTALTIGNTTTTENRTHSAADQINTIAGNAATHDLKGNLTEYEINGKDYTVEYDLDNRIVKVEVDNDDVEKHRRLVGVLDRSEATCPVGVSRLVEPANQYRYDAFGRRVIRNEGSTNTSLIWWGNSECAEHKHQAGTTVIQNDIMEHPSRLNSVIARAKDGSKFKLEWYHKNYLDHVYAVSDDTGDILEHYRYTAFGEVTIYDENGVQQVTTQIDNHILWNTRRRDEVTGYYMYKYRHYSPELGRWPSRDPIEEDGGINLYGFVGNNPIRYWDKLGWYEECCTEECFTENICETCSNTQLTVIVLATMDWHGNWGGEGRVNGQTGTWAETDWTWPTKGEKGFIAPVDLRDFCYYKHDKDLRDCGNIEDGKERKKCRRKADLMLALCIKAAIIQTINPGSKAIMEIEVYIFGNADSPNNNEGAYSPKPLK